jgi:hypothetical protein
MTLTFIPRCILMTYYFINSSFHLDTVLCSFAGPVPNGKAGEAARGRGTLPMSPSLVASIRADVHMDVLHAWLSVSPHHLTAAAGSHDRRPIIAVPCRVIELHQQKSSSVSMSGSTHSTWLVGKAGFRAPLSGTFEQTLHLHCY